MFRNRTACSWVALFSTVGLFSTLAMAAKPSKPAKLAQPAPRPIAAGSVAASQFHHGVQPLLQTYCYTCHAGPVKSGGVAFDRLAADPTAPGSRKLFRKVLENLRSGTMPPAEMPQPTAAEKERIAQWIKTSVYRIDPADPDPGRVTVRRLNRAEYRNTIRDLIGVDYDTRTEFPPDEAGHGFDNLSDVLTISPLLMEKYLNAAQDIVSQAVPTDSRVEAEAEIPGAAFVEKDAGAPPANVGGVRSLSYYEPATVSHTVQVEHPGDYQLVLDLSANENYVDNKFDYNRCGLIFTADGKELFRREYNREGGKPLHYVFDQTWKAGGHTLAFELQPLTPGVEQIRALTLRLDKVTLRGPKGAQYQVEPAHYRTFFPRPVPAGGPERREYARALLGGFARRAYRRPVDAQTVDRLAALAESVYSQPGQTFEAGVAQAMVAVLASPRFLFREEGVAAAQDRDRYALIDEYALASRLSYFLWSSMPDEELLRLADHGLLRKNLSAQVGRMLRDRRSDALIENFSGQWLQTRDIETVPINAGAVLARERDPAATAQAGGGQGRAYGRSRFQFDSSLRKALHQEVDQYFGYVVRDDRSVLELLDGNYTFLNARLAQYYGLAGLGVRGDEFRRVTLPPGSLRGGVLTMGSVLAVTSNPTRTSPVKRGQFILDNIVGAPAPPPPPNIPPLEAAAAGGTEHKATLREALAVHRSNPVCASCHERLDPPGLALENFNALGQWRDREFGQPIEASGTLVTGESFKDVRGLKQVLASRHRAEFYRCLTGKLLTYALGRGLEDYDVGTVDPIVARMQADDGRFSALVTGIIESAPFQKCRNPSRTAAGGRTPTASLSRGKTPQASPKFRVASGKEQRKP